MAIKNLEAAKESLENKTFISDVGCWIYFAATDHSGYGNIWIEGRCYKAHRVSYEITKGPIPDGMYVLHRCDKPSCVNPEHLFVGDQYANMRDMFSKGRQGDRSLEKNGRCILQRDDVNQIFNLLDQGYYQYEIASMFGVAQTTISYVKRRGRI